MTKKEQKIYTSSQLRDIYIVKNTAGSLKTSGYNTNEVSDSQNELVKDYFQKNPKTFLYTRRS